MATSNSLAVFDAQLMRALVVNDRAQFPEELGAFDIAIQGRRFRILTTQGILEQYRIEAAKFPPFQQQLQPTIDRLDRLRRTIHFDERQLDRFLNRSNIQLTGLPQEHREFIHDAIGAQASYCITHRPEWLDLSGQTHGQHGLQIVTPGRFVELER